MTEKTETTEEHSVPGRVKKMEEIKQREYAKGLKRVEDSLTEICVCVRNEDINGYDRLFGGRLMEWIDQTAGVVAARHCGGAITTAAVDNLQFKHGAFVNDIVVVRGKITYVGRTSMEVRVDSYVEDVSTGIRKVINRAYLTEVAIDDEGNPKEVPYGIRLETEVEKAEWEGALKRIQVRKARRREGF